jgi:hypothetical protein
MRCKSTNPGVSAYRFAVPDGDKFIRDHFAARLAGEYEPHRQGFLTNDSSARRLGLSASVNHNALTSIATCRRELA